MYYYFLFPFTLYSAVATLKATVIVRWKGWQKWYMSIVLISIYIYMYVISTLDMFSGDLLTYIVMLFYYYLKLFYYEQKITHYVCRCSLSRRAERCAEQKCS